MRINRSRRKSAKANGGDQAVPQQEQRVSLSLHLNRLHILRRLHLAIHEAGDLHNTADALGRLLPDLLNVDRATLLVPDPTLGILFSAWAYVRSGDAEPGFFPSHQPASHSISGIAYQQGQAVVVNDCLSSDLIPADIVQSLKLRSCVAIPIHRNNRVVGILRLDDNQNPNRFSEEEVEFLRVAGDLVGLALANAELMNESGRVNFSELRRAEWEKEILSGLGLKLAGANRVEEVADILRQATEDIWNWDAFHLMVRRSGRVLMQHVMEVDTINGEKTIMPSDQFRSSNPLRKSGAMREGKAILVNREPGDPGTLPRFGDTSRPSASLLFAPVGAGDEITGIISIQSYTQNRFQEQDGQLLLKVAETAAPALARCEAEQRSAAFASLGARLSSAQTPEEVATIASEVADELFGWDAFMLNLYSQMDGSVRALINFDVVDGKRQRVGPHAGKLNPKSLSWRAMHEGPILLLREENEFPSHFLPFGDASRPSASLMFVPVPGPGKVLGVMAAQSYMHHAYDEKDLDLLNALAHHCAGALERTQAEEMLRAREERYRRIITEAGAVPYQLDYATNQYVFVGEGIEAITGYSPEEFSVEVLRKLVIQTVPYGKSAGYSAKEAARLTRSGELKEWRADIQIRTRSNEIRWLADTTMQLQDEHGSAVGSLGILQDITDRKRTEEALRESEERYRRAITEAGAVPYEKSYLDDSFVFVGEGIERITGYPASTFTAERFREMIQESVVYGQGANLTTTEAIEAVRQGQIHHWQADIHIQTKSGKDRWLFDSSIQLLNEAGLPYGSLGILQDITERKQSEQALRESEERYALAVQGANDGLWDLDILRGQVYYSPRWLSMLGYEPGQLSCNLDEWFDRVHPEERETVKAHLESHIQTPAPHYESEHRMRHRDGTYLWVHARGVAVRDREGRAVRMAGSLSDITARKQAEERLVHGAYHDELTGLPNRAHFTETLERVLARIGRRKDYRFAVLFLDMDRFKVINDSLGHAVGDRLLVEVARRLEDCLRPGDMVARLGGDEFTILLDDIRDDADASRVACKIHEALSIPVMLDGHRVYSSASIGIALGTEGYKNPEELVRDADTAMYRAKEAGKTRSAIFDSGMHAKAVQRLRLEADLRQALEQTNNFHLQYQPIVALGSGSIRGVEALVRWRHPERGLVPPGEFIPLAEETGLILSLGWWVLERAWRQLYNWQSRRPERPPLTMSVNLSVAQLREADFCDRIETLLKKYPLAPESLVLEITESQLMSDTESLLEVLARLKQLRVELHVDDFGTGYSSLAYLHRFPIDMLKIDRTFVSRMTESSGTEEIVRAIITLGHSMNMQVIAEGIETLQQMEMVTAMNCDYGQGYLFSRPADTNGILKLLDAA